MKVMILDQLRIFLPLLPFVYFIFAFRRRLKYIVFPFAGVPEYTNEYRYTFAIFFIVNVESVCLNSSSNCFY